MSNSFSKKFVSARKLISYLKDYFASGNSFCWRGPVETVTKQVETVSLSGRRGLFISIHLSASVLCPSLVQNQNYL